MTNLKLAVSFVGYVLAVLGRLAVEAVRDGARWYFGLKKVSRGER